MRTVIASTLIVLCTLGPAQAQQVCVGPFVANDAGMAVSLFGESEARLEFASDYPVYCEWTEISETAALINCEDEDFAPEAIVFVDFDAGRNPLALVFRGQRFMMAC